MQVPRFSNVTIPGPVGELDTLRLASALETPPRGIVLVAHPNPTQGGTYHNKIVHTLAKLFSRRGYVAYCPNLRGVGKSAGEHDQGIGEVDDMAAVLAYALAQEGELPIVLAGFSFGTFVQSQLAARLDEAALEKLVLIAPACAKWSFPPVPAAKTLVIHGEDDEVAPLAATLDWVREQDLPVVVVPRVGHFFHGKLPQLGELVGRWV